MSHATSLKESRVERHLERQRGAGVRNISTTFEFSFKIRPSNGTELADHKGPPKKRRRTAARADVETQHICTSKASKGARQSVQHVKTVSHQTSHQTLPTIDAISKSHASELEHVVKHAIPVPSKKEARKRGRPRKDASQSATVSATQLNALTAASAIRVEVKRPGRQAAATARMKVTAGFLEEETSIDKKRRDPEVKDMTCGKQITSMRSGETVVLDNVPSKEVLPKKVKSNPGGDKIVTEVTESTKQPTASKARKARGKLGVQAPGLNARSSAGSGEQTLKNPPINRTLDQRNELAAQLIRNPLADAQSNRVIQPLSRQQSTRKQYPDVTQSISLMPARTSPPKLLAMDSKAVKRKRKSTKIYADVEPSAEIVLKHTASAPPIGQAATEVDELVLVDRRSKASRRAKDAIVIGSGSEEVTCDAKSDHLKSKSKVSKKLSPRHRSLRNNTGQLKYGTNPQIDSSHTNDQDVDWLFDKVDRRGLLQNPKQPIRGLRQKISRAQEDMDLDDLLSNIASFARQNS